MMPSISCAELRRGCQAFREREKRDAMYRVASGLVSTSWDRRDAHELADALGVLLLTWNQAFYRYGGFDFDRLERALGDKWEVLTGFRSRGILSFSSDSDGRALLRLFETFLDSLQVVYEDGSKARKSPVAVAKALHLLAPGFLPLWDNEIARKYDCYWQHSQMAAQSYLDFTVVSRALCEALTQEYSDAHGCALSDAVAAIEGELATGFYRRPLLKLIDEYNYAAYTKGWV